MKKITLLLVVILLPVLAFSQDEEEESFWSRIQYHGFFSQGFMYTGSNDYLTMETSEGSLEWQEAALNFSGWLNENWRFGAQIFSRNMGELNNYNLELDWAYLDFNFKDELSLRMGKIKTPFGFYNDQQDIEFLHTWVILPQSIYPVSLRSLNLSHQGFDLYGSIEISNEAEFTYQAFIGNRYVDREGGLFKKFSRNGYEIQDYSTELMSGLDVKLSLLNNRLVLSSSFMFDDYVIQGVRNSGASSGGGGQGGGGSGGGSGGGPGGGSGSGSGGGSGGQGQGKGKGPGSAFRLETDSSRKVYNFGLQARFGKLLLTGEYQESRESFIDEDNSRLPLVNSKGWYVSGVLQLNDLFEFGSYYSSYEPDKTSNIGQASQYQDDIAVTTRWQVLDYLILKGEFHLINGRALGVAPVQGVMPENSWNSFALKATINF